MSESHMITEKVWCCVCAGKGKVPRFIFFKKNCPVCDGEGQRRIMMDSRFPEDIKQMVRQDAIFGFNRFRPQGPLESAVSQVASFWL